MNLLEESVCELGVAVISLLKCDKNGEAKAVEITESKTAGAFGGCPFLRGSSAASEAKRPKCEAFRVVCEAVSQPAAGWLASAQKGRSHQMIRVRPSVVQNRRKNNR